MHTDLWVVFTLLDGKIMLMWPCPNCFIWRGFSSGIEIFEIISLPDIMLVSWILKVRQNEWRFGSVIHSDSPHLYRIYLRCILILSSHPKWSHSFRFYLQIHFMEQSLSWEANSCSDSQETPCFMGNLKVYYCVHKKMYFSYISCVLHSPSISSSPNPHILFL
jgi:hypothetical protein